MISNNICLNLGLGGDAEESLKNFMERVPVNYNGGVNIIPDELKKCHALDTWYTACFARSFESPQNPFNRPDFYDTLEKDIDGWLDEKSERELELCLVCILLTLFLIFYFSLVILCYLVYFFL